MTTELKFRIENAEDNAAELRIGFRTKDFAGESSSWITLSQLGDFVRNLSKYPLDPNSLPSLSGGFWDAAGSSVAQEHIHISAQPKGNLGQISIAIRVALPSESTTESKIKFSASAEITSDYGQLSEICRELSALGNATTREATFVFEREG